MWRNTLHHDVVSTLLGSELPAVLFYVKRDLLGEDGLSIEDVWELPEPKRILKQQREDGSWAGPSAKKPVYPETHADLVATFKQFRQLLERYELNRSVEPVSRAAEYLFDFQTEEGDIRGFIANQYATYYTGYVLSLLIGAGYSDDPRVERGMSWLLTMRQDDGGWTIPILTHHLDAKTMYQLTSAYHEPVQPDRSQPFSHNWTDMVLRAFAAHPAYRYSDEAVAAGELLKSRFFEPDVYSSRKAARYWVRFSHWWPNLVTSLESLTLLGFTADDPDIQAGIDWFIENQAEDGLWWLSNDKSRSPRVEKERAWLSLRICRVLRELLGAG